MKPDHFNATLDRLKLTKNGVARLLEQNPRTVRRWLSGASSIPVPVSVLMLAMHQGRITVAEVEAIRKHLQRMRLK